MESEIKKIISFIFKRIGKNQIKKTDFYLSLSVDLKWFSPDKAKELMDFALKNKLLIEKNNILEPNFKINEISLPFKYQPKITSFDSKKLINDNEQEIIEVKDIIFKKNNFDKIKENEINKRIEEICINKKLYSNTVSLLVFKELNIELSEYIKFAEQQIIED